MELKKKHTAIYKRLTSIEISNLINVKEYTTYYNTDDDTIVIYLNGSWHTISNSDMLITILHENWESGNFTANAWVVVNDSENVWIVANSESYSGDYSAYISNNNADPQYTINNSEVSHLYIDIDIPSGISEAMLEFTYKCEGEVNYDYLRVYDTPTSVTPTAGSQVSSSYQIGSSQYNDQSTWVTEEISLDISNAGTTRRIIFSWRNDGSVGTNPAAMLDNIKIKVK